MEPANSLAGFEVLLVCLMVQSELRIMGSQIQLLRAEALILILGMGPLAVLLAIALASFLGTHFAAKR
jgi:hypothetical protein